jgi:hypothetical protein
METCPRYSARRTLGENDAPSSGRDSSKRSISIPNIRTAQSIWEGVSSARRQFCARKEPDTFAIVPGISRTGVEQQLGGELLAFRGFGRKNWVPIGCASTILGLVGGGGLGQAIYNNVQLGFYTRLSTLILLVYALVLASDWIGERLRLSVA